MKRAGVPVEYRTARTKPEIALAEIDRVTAAGVRFGWVLADAGWAERAVSPSLTARNLSTAIGHLSNSRRKRRNATITGTSPRASVSDTRVWQLAFLPSAEAYCEATPTECLPSSAPRCHRLPSLHRCRRRACPLERAVRSLPAPRPQTPAATKFGNPVPRNLPKVVLSRAAGKHCEHMPLP